MDNLNGKHTDDIEKLRGSNDQALRDLRDKYNQKDKAKDGQLDVLKNWYNNTLNNKNKQLKD